MEEQKSFSQRVKETVIQCADLYKKYYVEYKYLLCSKAFVKLPKHVRDVWQSQKKWQSS